MRRWKWVPIAERVIFEELLLGVRAWWIPGGCKVLEVRHDPWRKAFCFLVENESFDEVPEGDEIPFFHMPEGSNYEIPAIVEPVVVDGKTGEWVKAR